MIHRSPERWKWCLGPGNWLRRFAIGGCRKVSWSVKQEFVLNGPFWIQDGLSAFSKRELRLVMLTLARNFSVPSMSPGVGLGHMVRPTDRLFDKLRGHAEA